MSAPARSRAPRCGSARCARRAAGWRSACRRPTRSSASGVTGTTCGAPATSAPRARPSSTSTRIPTGCAPPSCGATAASSRSAGTRPSPRPAASSAASSPPPGGRRWACTWATPTSTTWAGSSTSSRWSRRSAPATSSRPAPSTSGPRRSPRRCCSGRRSPCPSPTSTAPTISCCSGANPFDSNGSLATTPDWPGRLDAIRARGGRVVVVDPRRTATAERADEHVAIRPGGDAFLLFALLNVLAADGLVDPGPAAPFLQRARRRAPAGRAVHPRGRRAGDRHPRRHRAAAGPRSGRRSDRLRLRPDRHHHRRVRHAHLLAGRRPQRRHRQPRPARRRHVRQGRRRRRPTPGARPGSGGPSASAGTRSRVRGLPESLGELPVVCLAEEIDTPGDGQIQGLVTVAGNPVLSTPDAARLDAALAGLDAYVAVDPYVNETTRHADVILPVPSAAPAGPLRPLPLAAGAAQRRPLHAAGPAARPGRASTSGRCWPAWRSSPPGWSRVGTTPRWSTASSSGPWPPRRSPTRRARCRAATPTS